MRRKIVVVALSIVGLAVLCVGGFAGWFLYQLREMSPLETSQVSDSIFVVKGGISNMYLVKAGDHFVGFDAADNPDKIAAGCKSLQIDPSSVRAVFLTHSDADHVNGVTAFPSAKVYLPYDEVPLLQSTEHRHFLGMGHINKLPVSEYETLRDGDSVAVGDLVVHAISTAGHTPGSTCYRIGESLFTGDLCLVVDNEVRPMIKIFTEDMSMDSASIRRIAGLSGIRQMFTAHSGFAGDLDAALASWR